MYVGFAMSTETSKRRAAPPDTGWSWDRICRDPRFHDLPYKVETNARGQIVMSPTTQYHGNLQHRIGRLIDRALDSGAIVVESAIATTDGTKVADVAWYSDERWERVRDALDAPIAPEIAVEVYSPSNTEKKLVEKRNLYLEAGAEEVWTCDLKGHVRFYNENGALDHSTRVPSFQRRIEIS